jgi:hypothetical protein
MLSVCDIQGQWREKNTSNIWIVSGIVAERAKRPKGQKKPIVLSNGPQGVEWGNGNLKGSLEDGWLVWRNRRQEATYCWKKLENINDIPLPEPLPAPRKVKRTPPATSPPPPPLPLKPHTKEDQSPRSTNSAGTNDTAALAAGMAAMGVSNLPGMDGNSADGQPDGIAVAEMKMLVEMAGNRLMAGDVYMGMRYITLAQQVQPVLQQQLGAQLQQQLRA